MRRPSTLDTSKPSLCSVCWMRAFAATAAIALYSSAAFFTASIVGVLPRAERRDDHLGHPDFLRPVDALLLVLAQLAHAEMRALALHAVVLDDLLHLLRVRQRGELLVAERRAQLDALDADFLEHLQQPGEVAVADHLAVRIGLAADRLPEADLASRTVRRRRRPGIAAIAASVAVFLKNSRLVISVPRRKSSWSFRVSGICRTNPGSAGADRSCRSAIVMPWNCPG